VTIHAILQLVVSILLKICDDKDACTDDSCDPSNGCVFDRFNITAKCFNGDICKVWSCDINLGCQGAPVVCPNTFNDTCIATVCDPVQGCIPVPVVCNSTGENPDCFITYCDQAHTPDKCYSEEIESCVAAKVIGITGGIVLGAAAIAAIIAGAILCAGGTTVAAYIGFTKLFNGEFENKNPIFEKATQEGVNPAYGRESVFNTKPVKPPGQDIELK